MNRRILALISTTALVAASFVGCADNDVAGPSEASNIQAAAEIIAADDFFTSDLNYLDDGDVSLGKVDTAIIPRVWGRKIDRTSLQRNVVTTVLNDTTMESVVTHTFTGTFWIRARMQGDTTVRTYLKPFTEQTVRRVVLSKVANTAEPRRNWRISEVSAMEGGTISSPQVNIDNVTFFIGTDTLSISDPLAYAMRLGRPLRLGGMPELPPTFNDDFRVRVTITSSDTGNFVSAHRPYWTLATGWRYRAPMQLVSFTDNGNGTVTNVYEHSWRGVWSGRHHLMISAVTQSSLFDNVAPFSSEIWGIPFLVQ